MADKDRHSSSSHFNSRVGRGRIVGRKIELSNSEGVFILRRNLLLAATAAVQGEADGLVEAI